jgi:type IV pilus assembly protein PilA
VIIIIGILAAIAIPTFLAQREQGWEAAAQSDLRNAAAAATSCAVLDDGDYQACETAAQLDAFGYNATDGVTLVADGTVDAWSATATHDLDDGTTYTFDTATTGRVECDPATPDCT